MLRLTSASPTQHRTAIVAVVLILAAAACTDAQDPTIGDPPTAPGPTSTTTGPAGPTAEATRDGQVERIEITVSGGEVDGPGTLPVEAGTDVELVVDSDVDDHIHVHGYDLFQDVAAGETATLTFTADIPGVFEVELEDSGTPLLDLQVGG